jgi:hypothetical protein
MVVILLGGHRAFIHGVPHCGVISGGSAIRCAAGDLAWSFQTSRTTDRSPMRDFVFA